MAEDKAKAPAKPKPFLTPKLLRKAVRNMEQAIYGPNYDSCPLRRYTRSNGGHCSGGGGAC